RYRPHNLLLNSLGPGPHEETADEFQCSFAATVTELLMLYDDGILVRMPKYPSGIYLAFESSHFGSDQFQWRHVRVILVAICCDHPAMCKVGGFADHRSNKFPCSQCKITHDDIQTPAGLKVDGKCPSRVLFTKMLILLNTFPRRNGEKHKWDGPAHCLAPC
ncbi:hypothetical protein C8R44DRAFT_607800, partial [Mycena epipterygia]